MSEPRFNYTSNAWQGAKYDGSLGIKDIAKIVRKELKKKYPTTKWSVTIQRYAGGQAMDVKLMSSDFNIFAPVDRVVAEQIYDRQRCTSPDEFLEYWKKDIEGGHPNINQFYLDDDYRLNDKGKEVLKFAREVADSFNFDDSDAMVDYFHTNFYLHLGIGKWDKAYQLIK